jgi:hypothetical protein
MEGLEKVTRRGVNESQSTILYEGNLAYIPTHTQCPSLLTRLRPHSYRKSCWPLEWVRKHQITAKDHNQCRQSYVRDWQSRSNHKTTQILPHISLNTFWACSGDQPESAIRTRKTWAHSFGGTRIWPGRVPATIHTHHEQNSQTGASTEETTGASTEETEAQPERKSLDTEVTCLRGNET